MPKRRRGSQVRSHPGRVRARHASPPGRHRRFEELVEDALASLPGPFAELIRREVAVVIEDEPSPAQLREQGLSSDEVLYGLYEGTPRTAWGADWAAAPNKITVFRLPLEEDFPDPLELVEEVRTTVLHELGHHLGIDDDRLLELGRD